jgi:hypothetical protein
VLVLALGVNKDISLMKSKTISIVLLLIIVLIVVFAIPSLQEVRPPSHGDGHIDQAASPEGLAVADAPKLAPWPVNETSYLEEPRTMVGSPIYADEATTEELTAAPLLLAPAFEMYKVVLGVDEQLALPGEPANLRIWIGDDGFAPDFSSGMSSAEGSIAALGDSAQIEAYAPAFRIEPDASKCIRIHPSGSEVRFKLYPQHAGEFAVGAIINLFDSPDCSGPPVPKTTTELKVQVKVNVVGWFQGRLTELWAIFWENALEFWASLLALIFATALFLVRGKLKKWFGFKAE